MNNSPRGLVSPGLLVGPGGGGGGTVGPLARRYVIRSLSSVAWRESLLVTQRSPFCHFNTWFQALCVGLK